MDSFDRRALELQRAGQELFRKKDYQGALLKFQDALTHAIRVNTQVGILDNRAAVLTKAQPNDLDSALRDARRIMKLQKANAAGYLRAGQILQLMGKMDVAGEMYEYGLTQIGVGDQNGKKQLVAMQERLTTRLAAKTRMDPFRSLPLELAHMVLKDLPFSSVVRMQRVCKGWREFLVNYQCRLAHLDFSGATKPPSVKTIKTYLNRMQHNITSITILKPNTIDTVILKLMVKTPEKLQELRIGSRYQGSLDIPSAVRLRPTLKLIEIHGSISIRGVFQIVFNSPFLESLICHNIYGDDPFDLDMEAYIVKEPSFQLKRLRLALGAHSPDLAEFPSSDVLQFLPRLEALELIGAGFGGLHPDLTHLKKLETLILQSSEAELFPLLPGSIKHLNLSKSALLRFRVDDIEESPLPNLQELHVSECPWLGQIALEALIKPAKENGCLKALSIECVPAVDCSTLGWLLDEGTEEHLRRLSLAGNRMVGDSVVQHLVRLRGLERVDLSTTRISGAGVLTLVRDSSANLQWVGLDQCDHISNDTVDYMRNQGLEVSFIRTGTQVSRRGGRKVRYGY